MGHNKLAELEDAALVAHLEQAHRDLVRAQFALAASRLENTASLKGMRAAIARAETEIRRREIGASLPKNTLRAKFRGSFVPNDAAEEAAAGGFLADVVDAAAD